ncbi:MAG TPA: hypothetical protein VKB57_05245 [Acidimicrobiales bacterium]|nr:hypothetical protein [Acidimicrobiales bacterium]
MDDPMLDDDDRLLAFLGEVLDDMDPVPDDAVAAAHAANLLRLDGELAELVFDSLLDDRAVGVRDAATDVRSLTFSAGGRSLEIDLTDADVVGRVTPAEGVELELVQPSGRTPVPVDELGRFRAGLAPGPLRLQVSAVGAGLAATPWITR